MPVVPRYESQQTNQVAQAQQVQSAPLDVSPVTRGLDEVADYMKQRIDHEDNMRVLNAQTELQKQQNDLAYGENGFLNAEGLNAPAAVDGARKQWEKFKTDTLGGLTVGQREKLLPTLNSFDNNFNQRAMNHETTERKKASTAILGDSSKVQIETIKQNYNNPTVIDQSLSLINKNVSLLEAMDGDTKESLRLQANSMAIRGAAESALSQQIPDINAVKLLKEKYGDKLSADDSSAVDKMLKPIETDAQSTNLSTTIIAKHGIDNPVAQAKELLKITDPYIRGQVASKIDMQVSAYNKGQSLAQDEAINFIASGQQVPPKLMASLDDKSHANVLEYQQAFTDKAQVRQREVLRERANDVVTDVYDKALNDPNYLKTLDLAEVRAQFKLSGNVDLFNQLTKEQNKSKGFLEGGDASFYAHKAVLDRLKAFQVTDTDKNQKLNVMGIRAIDDIVTQLQVEAGEGKAIKKADIDKRVSELVAQGTLSSKGILYGTNERTGIRLQQKEGETFEPKQITISQVPASFVNAIRNQAKDEKKIINDQNIIDKYKQSIGQ
jgi:hypothetical protein